MLQPGGTMFEHAHSAIPAAGRMGWLRYPTVPRRDPRHLPPALALLQHLTTKPECLLRHHLGWLAPRVGDGASPNHPSYPKEEIKFIFSGLCSLAAFWLPMEGNSSSIKCCRSTRCVPGRISTLPLSQKVQLSLIFFHLFPLSLRTVNWQFIQSR